MSRGRKGLHVKEVKNGRGTECLGYRRRRGREGRAIGGGKGGATGGQGGERLCRYFIHPLGESPTLSSDREQDYWRMKRQRGRDY